MTRVLIYEKTYRRLQDRLSEIAGVTFLMFDDAGSVKVQGRATPPLEALPEVAWLSIDLYISPALSRFMQYLLDAPGLTWLHVSGAGLDHPAFPKLHAKGIRLTTSHVHAVSIAEFVISGVLDHYQRGPERRSAQAAGLWRNLFFREIKGTNWLMVGFGAIGQEVATRARAFGVKITAVRRDLTSCALADSVAPLSTLPDILPHADVVILCLPLNAATKHLVDAQFLGSMKAGSVLVNVGRGGLVYEPALLAALDAGIPAHAVLDVFQTEPLPADSRFWTHPRVALTAHGAGVTDNLFPRADALFFENLQQYVAGRELPHEVKTEDFPGKN